MPPASTADAQPIFFAVFPSPLGLLGLAASPAGLCRLKTNLKSEPAFRAQLKTLFNHDPVKKPQTLAPYWKQLDQYFAGKRRTFSCRLDLQQGTPFQLKVWRQLMNISYGATRSYEWLARTIGQPGACRAVGNANGKNPISIIIPCHRVVLKNGGLGGYTGGVRTKQFLLNLENTAHAAS